MSIDALYTGLLPKLVERTVKTLLLISSFLFCSTVFATCLDKNDTAHSCRHPAGDGWCSKRNHPPYAYRDKCIEALPGKRWLQIASRSTPEEAWNVARNYKNRFPDTKVFRAKNGWYSVTIGKVDDKAQNDVLTSLVKNNSIPADSLYTTGRSWVEEVPLSLAGTNVPSVSNNAVSSSQQPSKPAVAKYGFKFSNKCNHPVKLAIRYFDENRTWITKGWWNIEPGASSYLADTNNNRVMTNNATWYYYAIATDDSGYVWNGTHEFSYHGGILPMQKLTDKNGDSEWSVSCDPKAELPVSIATSQTQPSNAVIKELFNRALNNAYNLHDGVAALFTGQGDTVSGYFKFHVTSVNATGCERYGENVVSCVVSYHVETAASDPITRMMTGMANVKPVRREFQLRGDRWYLLPQN